MRATIACVAAALVVSLLGCGGSDAPAAPAPAAADPLPAAAADWTMLVYVAADNNLEAAALENVKQMAAQGSSANVNIVVQIDRSAGKKQRGGYSVAPLLNVPAFTTTKRLWLKKGAVQEVADLGEIDTGDPAALSDFITWGLTNFPSSKSALVLWDHGGGVTGFGWDDTSNHHHLTLSDTGKAVTSGLQRAGKAKLDLLGFDACLMGNLEIAYELRNLADWFVGSEELEPAHGWDYGPVIAAAASKVAPRELGRSIIDGYAASCVSHKTAPQCTLALVDMSKVEAVASAANQLGNALKGKVVTVEAWSEVATAQSKAEEYGKSPGSRSKFGVIDALDFARKSPADEGTRAALQGAIEAAVVANYRGQARPNAHGLTLFFGSTPELRTADYASLQFAQLDGWQPFLSSYYETAKGRPTPAVTEVTATPKEESVGVQGTVSDPLFVKEVDGLVAMEKGDGAVTVLSLLRLPDNATSFDWDRTLPQLVDGAGVTSGVTLFEEDRYTDEDGSEVRIFSFDADYFPPDAGPDEAVSVVAYFAQDASGESLLVGLYEFADNGSASEIEVEPGATLEPTLYGLDASDQESWTPSGAPLSLDDLDALRLENAPAPAGDYFLGIGVVDLSDTQTFSGADVSVP